MKIKISYLVAIPVAALVFTACSSGTPAATVTVTATATETETRPAPEPAPEPDTDILSESEKDEQYVLLLSTKVNIYGIDDGTLTELGRTICMSLDRGMDVESIYMVAKSNGLSDDEAAAIIAAAIVVYCPQHESSV